DGVSIHGALNNLNWLRNSESYSKQMSYHGHTGLCRNASPCGGGINCIHNVSTLGNDYHGLFDPYDPYGCAGDGTDSFCLSFKAAPSISCSTFESERTTFVIEQP